ncbi:flagellar filament capping protein FliD [Altererythrobacter xixiisoli]|uniref:Flagellar hook-associated protein 2 n=1 Tax=Croceibacterium xixiisoli TaxID=1476466 RepID=A0A6I4TUC8_9SPHN|nr:flagellar filament capping protein FliD [Croceibacterium xixiisoli]MXO98447.1 flagellar filament capping protein FliD [Croceibacterium xixiisoli]
MTTTSATSSIVSALGAGSGVDMTALATNLANAQFQLRNERLTLQSEKVQRQISVASEIKNALSILANSLGDRVRVGDLSSQASVANSSVATASTPAGATGSGSYSLEVLSLARGQTLSSPAVANATTTVGAGSLTLRFGQTSGSGFTEDSSQAAVTIDIAAGATLTDVAAAINAKRSGVTAYVAQTVDGATLVFKGAEGAQSGFIVEATETAGQEGLAAFAWNPSAGGDASRLLAQSADASFMLDGLAMTSKTNVTGQVAPGLVLSLKGTNAGSPTTVAFSSPTATIADAMQDLVTALNEIIGGLNTATDPSTGDLAGDSGARALKRSLASLGTEVIMPNAAAGAPRTLSDLGLSVQRDGTFTLDSARLQATMSRDPDAVSAMFTTGLYGVYATVDKISRNAAKTGDPGTIGGSITRYQKLSTELAKATTKLAEQQETLRAQMVARFAKADTRISQSQSTLSFLQSQIAVWNKSDD